MDLVEPVQPVRALPGSIIRKQPKAATNGNRFFGRIILTWESWYRQSAFYSSRRCDRFESEANYRPFEGQGTRVSSFDEADKLNDSISKCFVEDFGRAATDVSHHSDHITSGDVVGNDSFEMSDDPLLAVKSCRD
jgi:hypothetical protein